MSLLKLPFVFSQTWGMHIVATPPNPPPPPTEQVKNKREMIMRNVAPWPTAFVKGVFWAAGIAETAVVIANQFPSSRISKNVLSGLVLTGAPDRIRLTPFFIIGSILTSLGGFIRFKCYRELGRFFTFELSVKKDHKLITSGPYSIVRHPSYTGAILAVVGGLLCSAAHGSWVRESGILDTLTGKVIASLWALFACAIVTGLMLRTPKEDGVMKAEFGDAWVEWAKKVPYKLFPGIY